MDARQSVSGVSPEDVLTPEQMKRAAELAPPEVVRATTDLYASFVRPRSRRFLLRGAAVGAAGAAAIGSGVLAALPAFAEGQKAKAAATDSVKTILSIAATAEQLAITFYKNGIANHERMGIGYTETVWLKSAAQEEQIHLNLFESLGGVPLTGTFSFPCGGGTFTNKATFIATQQQLEGAFDSAFLAAIVEFCNLGLPLYSRISGQIACIEAEHRVLGRVIGGFTTADNEAFEPALLDTVGQAPGVLKSAGYLSPREGNRYAFSPYTENNPDIIDRSPYDKMVADLPHC
jgi:hypothetical protein